MINRSKKRVTKKSQEGGYSLGGERGLCLGGALESLSMANKVLTPNLGSSFTRWLHYNLLCFMCFLYFCYIHKTFLKILIKEAEPMSHPWRWMQYTVAVPNKRERDSLNVTVLSHHVLESMAAAISCRWQFLCYLCKGWYCFSYARVDVQQVSPLSDPLSILATVMCGSSNSAICLDT